MATKLSNLAGLLCEEGKYALAELMYKRAMSIDLKVVGPNHANTGADLNCLAELYSVQGKYAQAEPLYKSSLSILEKAYGPKHPNIATVLNNYAAVLRKTNRAKEAAVLDARAEAMRPIKKSVPEFRYQAPIQSVSFTINQ